jgi:hypothetical protein
VRLRPHPMSWVKFSQEEVTMTKVGAMLLGALPLLLATAAYAQAPGSQVGGTVQTYPYVPSETAPPNNGREPLFSIGNVPVSVWAPTEPTYNTQADRSAADNPLWPGVSLWSTD